MARPGTRGTSAQWHVIVLDANCTEIAGGCGPGSPQLRWLRRDLAANDARCTLAMWHQPRFSSGEHGNDPSVAPFWDALYEAGADLILNGHDHDYERFAPQDPDGNRDQSRGIVEIVVGTGGGEMRDVGPKVANSIVRRGLLLGVIQVDARADRLGVPLHLDRRLVLGQRSRRPATDRRARRADAARSRAARLAAHGGRQEGFEDDGRARPGGDHRGRRRRDVDRVPPRRARLDRHRAGRPGGADLGLDVPQRGAGRAAAEHRHADPDDDVRRRAVPAAGGGDRGRPVVARGRVAPPGVEPGPLRGAPAAGRLGGELRAPDRADLGDRGARPVPADDDRWRAGRGLAADRRLARPSNLAFALAAGARSAGATILNHHRVVGIGVQRRAGDRRGRGARRRALDHRGRGRGQRGGMYAPEIGRLAGITLPIIPMAHQYLLTAPIEGVEPGLPQLRDPDNLVYFREEVGGLCMGGYERNPMPWALDGVPPDFNHRLLDPDWPRFEEIMAGAIRRVPAIADAPVTRMINGPEGFTPDNEFILGEIGGPRAVRRRRVLRPRHRRGGRHRAPGGELDRRGRARARPVEDGHPALRRAVPEPLVHARPELRELRDLLRHPLPQRGTAGRPAAPRLTGVFAPRGPRRRLRGEVVVGARELVRAERGGARRGRRGRTRGAPARAAGRASTGARRSGRRPSRRGRPPPCSTRRRSPRSRSRVPARSGCCSGCARTTSTARPAASPTPSCSTGGAGSSATSP